MNVGGAPGFGLRTIGVDVVTGYMRRSDGVCVHHLFPVLLQMMRRWHGMVADTT
jgi:hypothetical protein